MKALTKIILAVFFLFSAFCSLLSVANAEIPKLINYQGRLTDSSGIPLNGSYQLTFRIYDAENTGILLWEENYSGVVIQKGIFSVLLGSVTNLDLPFDKSYWLEIKVNNEVMNSRQRIASVGYAIRAEVGEKIKVDSVDSTPGYLADKVDNSTIGLSAANKLQVKDGSITSGKVSAVLGSNSSRSVNVVYQAATDGFVVAYSNRYGGWGAIYGYTDPSNPPATIIADNNG